MTSDKSSNLETIDMDRLLSGLRELSKAFVDGRQGSYGMRIPAEPYRDGDLVCGGAGRLIERLRAVLHKGIHAASGARLCSCQGVPHASRTPCWYCEAAALLPGDSPPVHETFGDGGDELKSARDAAYEKWWKIATWVRGPGPDLKETFRAGWEARSVHQTAPETRRICLGCGEPCPCPSDCPAGSAVDMTSALCPGCEGWPKEGNNPCAVCGLDTRPVTAEKASGERCGMPHELYWRTCDLPKGHKDNHRSETEGSVCWWASDLTADQQREILAKRAQEIAADSYGCTGCRSTPCICDQLTENGSGEL